MRSADTSKKYTSHWLCKFKKKYVYITEMWINGVSILRESKRFLSIIFLKT